MMGILAFRFSSVLGDWFVEFVSAAWRGDEIKIIRICYWFIGNPAFDLFKFNFIPK